ncbi:hypothetical protein EON79_00540 [bacterium]|nr:MAG: hypothetical protein EON79_00540 [bacterium]
MDPRREKIVGFLLVASALGMVAILGLSWFFSVAGGFSMTATRDPISGAPTDGGTLNMLPLMLLFFVVCLGVFIGCLFYGIQYQKRSASGPRQVVENARVIARYLVGPNGEYLVESFDDDTVSVRYYVRLQTGFNQTYEYETSADTYYQCPEGAFGEAELQRRWLGRFTVYIGERHEG